MCTAMLYDPIDHYEPEETKEYFDKKSKGFERLQRLKQSKLLRRFLKKDDVSWRWWCKKSFLRYFFNF
jgi:hypothetical protein